MSVTTCIKCDNKTCREQLHFDRMTHASEWHLPEHWMTLVVGDTQLHSALHFCSKTCLRLWTGDQLLGQED